MVQVVGEIYFRCNECGKLFKADMKDIDFFIDDYSNEREMGPEVNYSINATLECSCGSEISISIDASEYPIGTIECEIPKICGAEYTERPRVLVVDPVYYSPERSSFTEGDEIQYGSKREVLKRLRSMDPREFELFVASLFYDLDYEVMVTQRTRDGGFDFKARQIKNGISTRIIGECKHYGYNRRIGVDIIRGLHDVQIQNKANIGIVVTSSDFSRDARKLAEDYGMTIWNGDYLVELGIRLNRF